MEGESWVVHLRRHWSWSRLPCCRLMASHGTSSSTSRPFRSTGACTAPALLSSWSALCCPPLSTSVLLLHRQEHLAPGSVRKCCCISNQAPTSEAHANFALWMSGAHRSLCQVFRDQVHELALFLRRPPAQHMDYRPQYHSFQENNQCQPEKDVPCPCAISHPPLAASGLHARVKCICPLHSKPVLCHSWQTGKLSEWGERDANDPVQKKISCHKKHSVSGPALALCPGIAELERLVFVAHCLRQPPQSIANLLPPGALGCMQLLQLLNLLLGPRALKVRITMR